MNGKKIASVICFFGFLAILSFIAFTGHRKQQEQEMEYELERQAVEEKLARDTVYNEEQIMERLTEAIILNEDDNVYMRVPTKYDQDSLMEMAKNIDPMLGRVTQLTYSIASSRNDDDDYSVQDDYAGVNFSFIKNDDYYVYEAIVEEKSIPNDRDKALKMKEVCQNFIDQNITSGMSEYEKELAIHDYIINNCDYSSQLTDDMTEFEAYGALVEHKAVCEGYSKATALLLRCCGIEATLVSGEANDSNAADTSNPDGSGSESVLMTSDGRVVDGHMWNQVKIDGLWYNLDTTWDDPTGDEPQLCHTYFNVDDAILRRNHEWDNKETNFCSSTVSNYYEKNGIYFRNDESFRDYVGQYLESGSREPLECAVTRADLSEETMSFIFNYDGISNYAISESGVDNYRIIHIYFNLE